MFFKSIEELIGSEDMNNLNNDHHSELYLNQLFECITFIRNLKVGYLSQTMVSYSWTQCISY